MTFNDILIHFLNTAIFPLLLAVLGTALTVIFAKINAWVKLQYNIINQRHLGFYHRSNGYLIKFGLKQTQNTLYVTRQ